MSWRDIKTLDDIKKLEEHLATDSEWGQLNSGEKQKALNELHLYLIENKIDAAKKVVFAAKKTRKPRAKKVEALPPQRAKRDNDTDSTGSLGPED